MTGKTGSNFPDGKEGFDFLGCHFRKRMSGKIWERERKRMFFLHRQPARRAMKRIRQRARSDAEGEMPCGPPHG